MSPYFLSASFVLVLYLPVIFRREDESIVPATTENGMFQFVSTAILQ